jgi:hypothetical protein
MKMEDQSWMYRSGDVLAHFHRVCAFLETALQHASCQKEDTIYYPCKICKNIVMFKDREVIRKHLVWSGFMDNYFIWTKHSETQPGTESIIDERAEENMGIPDDVCSHHNDRCEDDICQDDTNHSDKCFDVEELMRNVAPDVLLQRRNKGFNNFKMLDKSSRDLLYEKCKGCDKEHTVLWMMLELMKLKATSGWFDTSFSPLLELLTKVLPKPNNLPSSTYQAKKIICLLTLGIKKSTLARTIASYTKKNTNSKIGVKGAKLVSTNETITVRRLRMTLTKRAKKGEGERGRMSLLITTLKALKRKNFLLL